MLRSRQPLRHFQRIDNFRPQRKEFFKPLSMVLPEVIGFKLVGKLSHILVRRTFEGVTEPTLEDKMANTHDSELYTRC